MKNIIGTELKIDTISLLKRGNTSFYNELSKPIKIVVYSDSSNCSICELKLPTWRIKYKEFDMKNRNIGLIFILNSKQSEDIELNAKFSKTPGMQLYDSDGWFKKNNKISEDRMLHVFLLDKDNNIVLIGNPLENHELTNLYKNAMSMLVHSCSTSG